MDDASFQVQMNLADVDLARVPYEDHTSVIEGVISPLGQSGWSRSSECYVHSFSFAGWRRIHGPMVEKKLTLLRPIPALLDARRQHHEFFDRFPVYSVQRFTVLLSRDQTRAVVEKALVVESPDHDLEHLSERLRKPVILSTEAFGDLILNPRLDWFEGKAEWNGKTIEIHFQKSIDGTIALALDAARRLWPDQAEWKRKVDEFAVMDLLSLKNETWLDEDEKPVTVTEFKERMRLTAIQFTRDGKFEFWHEDGDLFWGHAIVVAGNLHDGPTKADIPG